MKDPMEVMDELAKDGLPYWDYQEPEKKKKYTKYKVYALLGIAFLVAMFFIFKPSKSKTTSSEFSLPEPTEVVLPEQKQKVYQMEAWLQKQRDTHTNAQELSEFYSSGNESEKEVPFLEEDYMQWASFYTDGVTEVTEHLKDIYRRKQPLEPITSILAPNKQDLFDRVDQQINTLPEASTVDPYKLMEQSMAMASLLMPKQSMDVSKEYKEELSSYSSLIKTAKVQRVDYDPMDIVSTLVAWPNEKDTSVAKAIELPPFKEEFFTPIGLESQVKRTKNTIKAVVGEDCIFQDQAFIKIELKEDMLVDDLLLKKGSILQAKAYVNQKRLELEITSVLVEGYIIGVSLIGYDTYGNRGLGIYEYKQIKDINELAAHLGSTASNSISFNSSAQDQIITNLSGDLIKGVGGIFSKNLRSVKVFLEKDKEILFVYGT